jgi:hypothetical protein
MELKLEVSKKILEKLERIQDLESKKGAASLEQTLQAVVDLYLQENDPLEKATPARGPSKLSRKKN